MPVKLNFKNGREWAAQWYETIPSAINVAEAKFDTSVAMIEKGDHSLGFWPVIEKEAAALLQLPSTDGWLEMRRAWMFIHLCNMTTVANPRQEDKRLHEKTISALLGFLALGEDKLARWTALHLQKFGRQAFVLTKPPASELLGCCLEAFASGDERRFQALRHHRNLSYYKLLFDAWHAPGDFAQAVVEALDFHAVLTRSDRDYDKEPLYSWPLEITAMRMIRQREGLPFPQVDHQYCQSPYYDLLPPEMPPFEDADYRDIAETMLAPDFFETSLARMQDEIDQIVASAELAVCPSNLQGNGPATQEEFEALLLSDDPQAEAKAAEYAGCIVIDWREEPEAVVAEFDERLPKGALTQSFSGKNDEKLVLEYRGSDKPKKVTVQVQDCEEPPAFDVMKAMARIIRPDFETRAFAWSLETDTAVIYVAKADWWKAMEKKSKKFKALFQKV